MTLITIYFYKVVVKPSEKNRKCLFKFIDAYFLKLASLVSSLTFYICGSEKVEQITKKNIE